MTRKQGTRSHNTRARTHVHIHTNVVTYTYTHVLAHPHARVSTHTRPKDGIATSRVRRGRRKLKGRHKERTAQTMTLDFWTSEHGRATTQRETQ